LKEQRGRVVVKKRSVREIRENLDDILERICATKEPIIVEENGKALVAIVSIEQLEQLLSQDEEAWKVIRQVQAQNEDKTEEEVERDVANAVEEVRQELHDRARSTTRGH
jgi:PHD/YefM family antitoxin component YafN of YafNO toxin-antitoxin module